MAPPLFPIRPSELRGEWSFETIEPGWHDLEGFRVLAAEIPHKGGRTFGYRVEDGAGAVAYLSDHAPHDIGPGPHGWGEYHDAARQLAAGVDLLIHDAQYEADELATKGSFGHAAAPYAAGLGELAGARRVLLFHHDPSRTDDDVEALTRRVAARFPDLDVRAAIEGTHIDV
jgi:phosphoribosyl 1,2-cyclic phosphodiesterase